MRAGAPVAARSAPSNRCCSRSAPAVRTALRRNSNPRNLNRSEARTVGRIHSSRRPDRRRIRKDPSPNRVPTNRAPRASPNPSQIQNRNRNPSSRQNRARGSHTRRIRDCRNHRCQTHGCRHPLSRHYEIHPRPRHPRNPERPQMNASCHPRSHCEPQIRCVRCSRDPR